MLPAGLPNVSQKTARVFSSISGARRRARITTFRGDPAALERLQSTAQPPRLIATPSGDHSAYHPAIWRRSETRCCRKFEVAAWARDTSASVCDQVGGEVFFVSADTAGGR